MDYDENQTRNNQYVSFFMESTKYAAEKWPEFMVTIRPSPVARADCRQACRRLEMFYISRFLIAASLTCRVMP